MPTPHAALLLKSPAPAVSPEADILEIFTLLQQPEATCLLVRTESGPLGIITPESFLLALSDNGMRPDGLRAPDAMLGLSSGDAQEKRMVAACLAAARHPAPHPGKLGEQGQSLPSVFPSGALTRDDLLEWIQLSNEICLQELQRLSKNTTVLSTHTPPAEALQRMQQEHSEYLVLQLPDQSCKALSAKDCLKLCLDPTATPRAAFADSGLAPTPCIDQNATVPEAWARILHTHAETLVMTDAAGRPQGVVNKPDLTQAIYGPVLDTLQGVLLSEQRTEQKYQTMFLNAGLGFFLARYDGRFINVNPAFARLMGYDTPEEMIQSVADIGSQLYVDPKKRLDLLQQLRQQGEVRNFEFEAQKKDGSTLWLLVNAAQADANVHYPESLEGTVLNITDRKRNEEAQRIIQTAQAANEAKSELLRNMSHEIRTPLNALIGMADLLWSTDLNDEQRKLLHIITNSGHFLLELINHILNMAKMEAGEFSPQEAPFDLVDLVEDICEIMSVRVHEKKLELYNHLAPDVPQHLIGDPTCLRQILINLVGNAIKFTQNGFIDVHCELPQQYSGPSLQQGEIVLQFSVRDTGMGIPREKLDSVFGMFAQADTSITRRFGGTGLGLSISQKLVQMMQGRIWVESEPGRGSTFYFTVRLGLDRSPESKAIAEADIRGSSVLLLDNTERSRRQLKSLLQGWNVRVKEVDTGQECLDCFKDTSASPEFDAIIIDAQIPGREGYKTAFRIAKQYGMPDRLIMVFTPTTGSDNLSWVKEIGAAAYLFKPAKRKDLKRALLIALKRLSPLEGHGLAKSRPLLPQVRVLCAEDNEYNRIIIQNYLQDTPVALDFAEDGAIAVEKCSMTAYDLILMDIQLPVLDGLSATRAIRELEQQQQRPPTPILALTAHALDEEKEKSRQAGCNAHLTKPILRDTLFQAIRAYAGQSGPAAPGTVPQQAETNGPVARGNPRLKKHIPGYLDSCRDNLQKMRSGLESADHVLVERLGHSLKGSGGGFGFEPITTLGATIETAVRAGNFSAVGEALDALEVYLDTVTVVF